MNKNISIYSFFIAILTTVWLDTYTVAQPTVAKLSNQDSIAINSSAIAFNASDRESKNDLSKIGLFVGSIAVCAMFWSVFQSRKGTKPNFQTIKTKSNTALLDRVSPKLRRQLLRLVNDPKTVNRLLMGIYKNNSDRSPNWIAEKAIYDLRRGR